jgi:hypothetical protein
MAFNTRMRVAWVPIAVEDDMGSNTIMNMNKCTITLYEDYFKVHWLPSVAECYLLKKVLILD